MMASQFPPLLTAGFSAQEEAVAYVQNRFQERGYALTIKRSIPSLQQVHYCCDRESYQIRSNHSLTYPRTTASESGQFRRLNASVR